MWIKIVCFMMLTGAALGAEEFLSHLYGMNQRNKVVMCLKAAEGRRARSCSGAILHGEWVGVSAGCLRLHPDERLLALRLIDDESCDDLTHGYSSLHSRSVRSVFYHPWSDLALVLVDRLYLKLDNHPNSTRSTVQRTFRKHGIAGWIKNYINEFALDRDTEYHYKRMLETMSSTRSPILIFLLAVVLPSLLFVLVFFYVIHYTESTPEVSYKNLKYSKKVSRV